MLVLVLHLQPAASLVLLGPLLGCGSFLAVQLCHHLLALGALTRPPGLPGLLGPAEQAWNQLAGLAEVCWVPALRLHLGRRLTYRPSC